MRATDQELQTLGSLRQQIVCCDDRCCSAFGADGDLVYFYSLIVNGAQPLIFQQPFGVLASLEIRLSSTSRIGRNGRFLLPPLLEESCLVLESLRGHSLVAVGSQYRRRVLI